MRTRPQSRNENEAMPIYKAKRKSASAGRSRREKLDARNAAAPCAARLINTCAFTSAHMLRNMSNRRSRGAEPDDAVGRRIPMKSTLAINASWRAVMA